MAALRGKSIKAYVLERTLAAESGKDAALRELEKLLDERIHSAKAGAISRQTAKAVFAQTIRKKAT